MQIDLGDEMVFVDGTHPIATAILALAVVLFLGPRIWRFVQRRRGRGETGTNGAV
jgi:hypothetical protein